MYLLIYTFITVFTLYGNNVPLNRPGEAICINQEELDLYSLINNYREEKGLKAILLSASLSKVARTHARDLMKYYKSGTDCNPHSWSEHGEWTSCCYTNDHKEAQCMWDKPKEITEYKGAGYEILYWHSKAATAPKALEGWKNSPHHNQLIINTNMWAEASWNAIGVGIYKQYAIVWFGQEKDPAGVPDVCKF